jgi:hypothetical protein
LKKKKNKEIMANGKLTIAGGSELVLWRIAFSQIKSTNNLSPSVPVPRFRKQAVL